MNNTKTSHKKITRTIIFMSLLLCALPANSMPPFGQVTQSLKKDSTIAAVAQLIALGSAYAVQNFLNLYKS
jgi:hypothetical protein